MTPTYESTVTTTPLPAAPIPILHQSHPFWAGFNWSTLLEVLMATAQVAAPVAVAIANAQAAKK